MTDVKFNAALIVGAGSGLSASLARALAKDGIKVALAARTTGDLDPLVKDTGARAQQMLWNAGAYCRYCWMRVVRRPARPCWSIEYCQERNSSTVSV